MGLVVYTDELVLRAGIYLFVYTIVSVRTPTPTVETVGCVLLQMEVYVLLSHS